MKRNISRLIRAIIVVAVICVGCWFFGRNLKADMNLDSQLGTGYQLVYNVQVSTESDAGDTATQVQAAADVLIKRLKAFGATDCQATISDSNITIDVIGITDMDAIRPYLTMTGAISFRKSDDSLLMDGSVLKSYALGVAKSGDSVVGYLYVSDTSKFASYTTALALGTDKTMVVWVDYADGQTYKAESEKSSPAYLGANQVSAAINGNAVMTLSKSYDEATKLAVIVNSGSLATKVSEKSCDTLTAQFGAGAYDTVYRDLLIGTGLVLVAMVILFQATGLVAALYGALYMITMLACNSYLGNNFTVVTAAIAIAGLVFALGGLAMFCQDVKIGIRKNHGVLNSMDESFHAHAPEWIDMGVMALIGGLVLYLIGDANIKAAGLTMMLAAVGSALLVDFGTIWTLNDLAEGGLFAASNRLLGIKDSEIIDVKSGENYSYSNSFSKTDFATKDAKGYLPLLFVAVAAVGLVLIFVKGGITAVNTSIYRSVIIIAVIALAAVVYVGGRYRGCAGYVAGTMAMLNALLALGWYGLLQMSLDYQALDAAAVAASYGAVASVLVMSGFKRGFGEIHNEKINVEKIASCYNDAKSRLMIPFFIMLVMGVLLTLSLIGSAAMVRPAIAVALVMAAVLATALTFGARQWLDYQKQQLNAPKSIKKKSKKPELEEMTVYGINEVHRHKN